MRVLLSWLKKFLFTNADIEEIANTLTNIGFEVEDVIDNSKGLELFKIAQIDKVTPHPNASKLNICSVTDGTTQFQIICGASNVKDGLKVVMAPIGAVIPANQLQISQRSIRGVESFGMLCSAQELGLGEEGEGILELPEDVPVGESFATYIKDPIIEISITPNRGDCLSMVGIGRELAAANLGDLQIPNLAQFAHNTEEESLNKVIIEDEKACRIYSYALITNLTNQDSPSWLQASLKSMGTKSISLIVDIANYSMYSLGQPLHAFDYAKIQGTIRVRYAKEGEKFIALDGKLYELNNSDIVIADEQKILALAGIIGSMDSGCDENTQTILLEGAEFNAQAIAYSGRYHNIQTDARYRFERNIDPAMVEKTLLFASEMLCSLGQGTVQQIANLGKIRDSTIIKFNYSILKRITGIEIPIDTCLKILHKLQIESHKLDESTYNLTIPSWRADLTIEEDIVEEILRIYGYDNLPETDFVRNNLVSTRKNPGTDQIQKLKIIAATYGYTEVVTWSFMDIKNLFTAAEPNLELINPLSSELNYMRPTIVCNLLEILYKNSKRNFTNLSLFEIGPIYLSDTSQLDCLTLISTGYTTHNNIHGEQKLWSVYDLKAVCIKLLESYGIDLNELSYRFDVPSYYHPGRSIAYYINDKCILILGELHPLATHKFHIKPVVLAAEIFLNYIENDSTKAPKTFSNYQTVERDFAFIVEKNLPAIELLKATQNADNYINHAEVFDHYSSESLGEDKKSLAIRIYIEPQDHTLTDEEIQGISNKVLEAAYSLGAELR